MIKNYGTSKTSANLVLFVDDKFNISNLKKYISSSELSYITDLLKNSDFIIGNSSSGIREAEIFGTSAINIGNRQKGRIKAKSVIDVVIYRGGDIFWAWSFTGLTQVMGLGLGGIAIVGGFIATLWSYVALRLGRTFDESQIFDKSP